MKTYSVRVEQPGDEAAIAALTEAAFRASPHGDSGEAAIVERLRNSGDLAVSLVAVNMDLAIIGHCAVSKVTIGDSTPGWYGLGPVSVMPLRQRSGIGSRLVSECIEHLREMGARGCVVLGDPEFYSRFGFQNDPALTLQGVQSEYFLRLVLEGPEPHGSVQLSPAFSQAG